MYTIYLIRNKDNQPCYVGFTTKTPAEKRWVEHQLDSRRGSPFYFHKAIRKHGTKNFSFEVLCWGEDHEAGLKIAEPLMIEIFKPKYNSSVGGKGRIGIKLSESHKKKIRDRLVGKNRGPMSEAHKKKIRDKLIGKPLSMDHKIKISKARTGQKLSVRHRKKLSEAHKGVPLSKEHRHAISVSMKKS